MLCDPDRIDDDVLALMFISCHPVLSREARVALTLRVVGGLTSDEIARAFLVPTATVQARITRAKKTLAAARGAVRGAAGRRAPGAARLGAQRHLPDLHRGLERPRRASELIRPDLAREAIRLARMLARAGAGRAGGARAARPARADRRPLPGPDRRRRRAGAAGGPGPAPVGPRRDPPRAGRAGRRPGGSGAASAPYGLQAAIAECHAVAPSVEETDWERIVLLYEALGRLAPSPVVELNRAVAVSMAERAGRRRCRSSTSWSPAGSLAGLAPAARASAASCCARLGRRPRSARRAGAGGPAVRATQRERAVLLRKAAALT